MEAIIKRIEYYSSESMLINADLQKEVSDYDCEIMGVQNHHIVSRQQWARHKTWLKNNLQTIEIDPFLLHQANSFMLNHPRKLSQIDKNTHP